MVEFSDIRIVVNLNLKWVWDYRLGDFNLIKQLVELVLIN